LYLANAASVNDPVPVAGHLTLHTHYTTRYFNRSFFIFLRFLKYSLQEGSC